MPVTCLRRRLAALSRTEGRGRRIGQGRRSEAALETGRGCSRGRYCGVVVAELTGSLLRAPSRAFCRGGRRRVRPRLPRPGDYFQGSRREAGRPRAGDSLASRRRLRRANTKTASGKAVSQAARPRRLNISTRQASAKGEATSVSTGIGKGRVAGIGNCRGTKAATSGRDKSSGEVRPAGSAAENTSNVCLTGLAGSGLCRRSTLTGRVGLRGLSFAAATELSTASFRRAVTDLTTVRRSGPICSATRSAARSCELSSGPVEAVWRRKGWQRRSYAPTARLEAPRGRIRRFRPGRRRRVGTFLRSLCSSCASFGLASVASGGLSSRGSRLASGSGSSCWGHGLCREPSGRPSCSAAGRPGLTAATNSRTSRCFFF